MHLRLPLTFLAAAGIATGGTVLPSGATFVSHTANQNNSFTAAPDWTAPSVTLTDPGTPLHGTVSLAATAVDGETGIASVRFQVAPAGTSSWTTLCTATTAPYTCSSDTTKLADGSYDFRAVATDNAGNTATSLVAGRAVDNTSFAVSLADPGSFLKGSVALNASVTGTATVSSVKIQIKQTDATTWTDVCTDTTSPYGCTLDTTKYAADLYDLRAVATNSLGSTVVSTEVNDVTIDNVAPATPVLTDPGLVRGVVTLSATASDAESGVASVVIQRSPTGKNTWTDICTDTTDPYSCRFDSTTSATPDGKYDFRVVASDYSGNTATSKLVTDPIDNSVASVSLDDPGAYLRGSVALTATTVSSTGVQQVVIQRAPAGTTTWTTICTDTSSPFGCTWDTTTVADGSYDLRAVMTPTVGSAVTSNVVTARKVDNSVIRGSDVQAANGAAKVGKVETGDTFTLSWSEAVKASTLVPGWTGSAPTTITVRLRDGNVAGLNVGSQHDTLDFNGTAPGLGSIDLRGDYIRTNKTATWQATVAMAASGSAVTVTLGAQSGGGTRTWTTPTAMVWSPSATATDLAGNPSSTTPATESGTLDKDF